MYHNVADLNQIFATSRDEAELKYAWVEWRNQVGKPLLPLFKKYVALANEGAKAHGRNPNFENHFFLLHFSNEFKPFVTNKN